MVPNGIRYFLENDKYLLGEHVAVSINYEADFELPLYDEITGEKFAETKIYQLPPLEEYKESWDRCQSLYADNEEVEDDDDVEDTLSGAVVKRNEHGWTSIRHGVDKAKEAMAKKSASSSSASSVSDSGSAKSKKYQRKRRMTHFDRNVADEVGVNKRTFKIE